MCFRSSRGEVQTRSALKTRQNVTCPAACETAGCLAARSQNAAADKTIQQRFGEQWSASRSALASSQKCVHAAHRSWAEAADTVRQVYSKI